MGRRGTRIFLESLCWCWCFARFVSSFHHLSISAARQLGSSGVEIRRILIVVVVVGRVVEGVVVVVVLVIVCT